MLLINRINIKKLDPVTKGELVLELDNEVLIIGANGSGKTSLLRLVNALRTFSFLEFFESIGIADKEYSLDIEYTASFSMFRYEVSIIESIEKVQMTLSLDELKKLSSFEKQPLKKNLEISIKIHKDDEFKYQINLNNDTFTLKDSSRVISSFPINTVPELGIRTKAMGRIFDLLSWSSFQLRSSSPVVSDSEASSIDEALAPILLRGHAKRGVFEEGNSFFDNICKGSLITYFSRLNKKGEVEMEGVMPSGSISTIFPMGFSFQNRSSWLLSQVKQAILDKKEILIAGKDQLGFLEEACEQLGVLDIKFIFMIDKKDKKDDENNYVWILKQIRVVVDQDEEFDAQRLSYGQKRFFGLVTYFAEDTSEPLLVDEPINGLHHSFVDYFYFTLRRNAQLFMTTQSPWLLDYVDLSSEEIAMKKIIICKKNHDGFNWRNLDKQEAASIVSAKQTGIERTDEILKSRGIW